MQPPVIEAPATVIAPVAAQVVAKPDEKALIPTTTAEEQRITQRRQDINLIWELTQALIAVAVTVAEIYAAMKGKDSPAINNAFTLIVAIYFVRTNHVRMGGVGGEQPRS